MDSETRIKLLICLVSHFGSFDNSCSFDSWTLPAWSPPAADTRFMLSRVRVHASIHKSGHGKYTFKRSAFVFPVPNRLCGWRHLLALGAGIMRVSATDGHHRGSVRLANVHKLRAEIRYLTNLRNLRELFRYPSPENPGGRQSRTKISVGSFSNLTFTSRQMPKMWAWRVSI